MIDSLETTETFSAFQYNTTVKPKFDSPLSPSTFSAFQYNTTVKLRC